MRSACACISETQEFHSRQAFSIPSDSKSIATQSRRSSNAKSCICFVDSAQISSRDRLARRQQSIRFLDWHDCLSILAAKRILLQFENTLQLQKTHFSDNISNNLLCQDDGEISSAFFNKSSSNAPFSRELCVSFGIVGTELRVVRDRL